MIVVGSRYGRLTITECLGKSKTGTQWSCVCDCGNYVVRNTSSINAGTSKSCGCINKTHGMSEEVLYSRWLDMKKRCDNKDHSSFLNYGGRGIKYCESWSRFENFMKDMGPDFDETLTLERLDVNGDYCKENCEWVPVKDQALNKRRYKNNKLGIGNISLVDSRGIPTVKCRIQDPESGKRLCKFFSVNRYGYEEALRLANIWVSETRNKFGYKETHGSEG